MFWSYLTIHNVVQQVGIELSVCNIVALKMCNGILVVN